MNEILYDARKIAYESGSILLQYMNEKKEIKLKGVSNLVTQVDKISEEKIINLIEKRFPDHSIISEEIGKIEKGSDFEWIIDPLDGTTNYAHGVPVFSISLALKKKDRLILGIVYDPVRNELFSAYRGQGAYLNDTKIKISSTQKLEDALISTGFPYELSLKEENFIPFINFSSRTHGIRRMGSAALEIAYVGCGRLDGFWAKKLKLWDIAGGIVIVEEAGGKVTNFKGEDLTSQEETFLATNGFIHQEMTKILNLERIVID